MRQILTGDALANELRGFFDRPTLSVQLEGPGRPISPVVERPAGRLYQAVGRQARVAGLVGMALLGPMTVSPAHAAGCESVIPVLQLCDNGSGVSIRSANPLQPSSEQQQEQYRQQQEQRTQQAGAYRSQATTIASKALRLTQSWLAAPASYGGNGSFAMKRDDQLLAATNDIRNRADSLYRSMESPYSDHNSILSQTFDLMAVVSRNSKRDQGMQNQAVSIQAEAQTLYKTANQYNQGRDGGLVGSILKRMSSAAPTHSRHQPEPEM